MTNLPQVFNGHQVRSIFKDDEPVWVAKDVCAVLGLKNHSQAIKKLDDDEKDGVTLNDPMGRPQQFTVVNESGLYHLIVRSDKPVAKEFRRWITHEVLPAIRKSGNYGVADTLHLVESVAEPLKKENEELKSKVIALLEEKIARQEEEIREVKKAKTKPRFIKRWTILEKAEVMRLRESGMMPKEISERFGVTASAISDLILRMRGLK